MARWGIAKATVQRVFHVLTQDGFLLPRGAAGTFVAEYPPHLYQLALTFPFYADQLPMSRFYMGIRAEAAKIALGGPWRISPYYGLDDRQLSPDSVRLLADIAAHRVGGIILAAPNYHLFTHLAKANPCFPGVAIASAPNALLPRMPVIYPDGEAWMQQALRQLAARGRRRVALVTYALPPGGEQRFIQQAAEYGLTAAPYRIFCTASNSAAILRNAVHCLMRLPAALRPDALLIADDNLVEATVAGLHDAGVRVPGELDIVAACNYPHLPASALPVCWLGPISMNCCNGASAY